MFDETTARTSLLYKRGRARICTDALAARVWVALTQRSESQRCGPRLAGRSHCLYKPRRRAARAAIYTWLVVGPDAVAARSSSSAACVQSLRTAARIIRNIGSAVGVVGGSLFCNGSLKVFAAGGVSCSTANIMNEGESVGTSLPLPESLDERCTSQPSEHGPQETVLEESERARLHAARVCVSAGYRNSSARSTASSCSPGTRCAGGGHSGPPFSAHSPAAQGFLIRPTKPNSHPTPMLSFSLRAVGYGQLVL